MLIASQCHLVAHHLATVFIRLQVDVQFDSFPALSMASNFGGPGHNIGFNASVAALRKSESESRFSISSKSLASCF